jgi:hypothetical protein
LVTSPEKCTAGVTYSVLGVLMKMRLLYAKVVLLESKVSVNYRFKLNYSGPVSLESP